MTRPKLLLTIAALMLALVFTLFTGDLIRLVISTRPEAMPWLRPLLASSLDLLAITVLMALVAIHPARLFAATGIFANPLRPLMASVAVFAPVYAAAHLTTGGLAPFELKELIWGVGGAALFEELTYRGLALGVLVRLCGLPFWAAALMPAAVFGAAHLAQGDDLANTAAVVAITGLGGLFFGWLWTAWNWNLWPAIFAHAGLNLMWTLYGLGDDAAGGLAGNLLRGAAVAGLIAGTIWLRPWLDRWLQPKTVPAAIADPR